MPLVSVTYASSPSSDLLISTLEFNNEKPDYSGLFFYIIFSYMS